MVRPHRFVLTSAMFLATACLFACGGSQKELNTLPLESELTVEDEVPGETVATPLTELDRTQVRSTVDAGFGRFLQSVEVEAMVLDGKFQGFRIVRFTKPEEWRGVGLLPGDVVDHVNGQTIERPEQAFAVFASLKTASVLEVSYTREGHPMRLSFPIVDRSPPPPVTAAPAASASAPAGSLPAVAPPAAAPAATAQPAAAPAKPVVPPAAPAKP